MRWADGGGNTSCENIRDVPSVHVEVHLGYTERAREFSAGAFQDAE